MQNALVHEHIVHLLSQPNSVRKVVRLTVRGRALELTGYSPSHWAALCYVSSLAAEHSTLSRELSGGDKDMLEKVRERCALHTSQRNATVACRLHAQ